MSVKIYNNTGHIIIDGKQPNLAFIEVADIVNMGYFNLASFVNTGVAAVPLDSECEIINSVYRPTTKDNTDAWFGDSVIGKNYHISLFCPKKATGKAYLFGTADNIAPQGRAGMRLFSPDDGKLLYDSRLKYLNIVGICQDGLALDPHKKYGLLQTINPDTVTFSGENSGFIDEIQDIIIWINQDNHLRLQRYDVINGRYYDMPKDYKPYYQPPLLVDLSVIAE